MKVGDLVRYVDDGDFGVITSIDKNGYYCVEFVSGQTTDCIFSELEQIR